MWGKKHHRLAYSAFLVVSKTRLVLKNHLLTGTGSVVVVGFVTIRFVGWRVLFSSFRSLFLFACFVVLFVCLFFSSVAPVGTARLDDAVAGDGGAAGGGVGLFADVDDDGRPVLGRRQQLVAAAGSELRQSGQQVEVDDGLRLGRRRPADRRRGRRRDQELTHRRRQRQKLGAAPVPKKKNIEAVGTR